MMSRPQRYHVDSHWTNTDPLGRGGATRRFCVTIPEPLPATVMSQATNAPLIHDEFVEFPVTVISVHCKSTIPSIVPVALPPNWLLTGLLQGTGVLTCHIAIPPNVLENGLVLSKLPPIAAISMFKLPPV